MRRLLLVLVVCTGPAWPADGRADGEEPIEPRPSNVSGASPQAPRDPDLPPLARPDSTPADAAPGAPDLRPPPGRALRPAVTDVFGLKELADADPQVRERYQAIKGRRVGSVVALAGAGLGLVTAGLIAAAESTDATLDANVTCAVSGLFGSRQPCPQPKPNYTAAYVTLGISAILGISALIIWPRRGEIDSAVALWNTRHPEDRVALDRTLPAAEAKDSAPSAPGP